MSHRDALSRAQMGHLLADEPWGFSVRGYASGAGDSAGDRAEHGYMVATEGQGQDYVPSATTSEAMDFIGQREAALRRPENYFGGYQGQDPARTALDVARKFPETFTGNVAAGTQAMRLNQEAYGHLAAYDDYTDLPNPYYEPGAGHSARPVSLEQMGSVIDVAHGRHPDEGIDSPAPSRSAELTSPWKVR